MKTKRNKNVIDINEVVKPLKCKENKKTNDIAELLSGWNVKEIKNPMIPAVPDTVEFWGVPVSKTHIGTGNFWIWRSG